MERDLLFFILCKDIFLKKMMNQMVQKVNDKVLIREDDNKIVGNNMNHFFPQDC